MPLRMLKSAGEGFAKDAQKLANKQRAERQHFKGFAGLEEAKQSDHGPICLLNDDLMVWAGGWRAGDGATVRAI